MNDNTPTGKQVAGFAFLGLLVVIALTWISQGNDYLRILAGLQ